MTIDEVRAAAAQLREQSRAAQHLPAVVDDDRVLDRVAAMMRRPPSAAPAVFETGDAGAAEPFGGPGSPDRPAPAPGPSVDSSRAAS